VFEIYKLLQRMKKKICLKEYKFVLLSTQSNTVFLYIKPKLVFSSSFHLDRHLVTNHLLFVIYSFTLCNAWVSNGIMRCEAIWRIPSPTWAFCNVFLFSWILTWGFTSFSRDFLWGFNIFLRNIYLDGFMVFIFWRDVASIQLLATLQTPCIFLLLHCLLNTSSISSITPCTFLWLLVSSWSHPSSSFRFFCNEFYILPIFL